MIEMSWPCGQISIIIINHSGSSQGTQRHFITCTNTGAVDYYKHGRHHVMLPLSQCRDVTGDGKETTVNVMFTCRSSCSVKSGNKGINHKQLSLICQLETKAGLVVGCRVISLKVSVPLAVTSRLSTNKALGTERGRGQCQKRPTVRLPQVASRRLATLRPENIGAE